MTRRIKSWAAARWDWLLGTFLLATVLSIAFAPAIFGGRTLLLASWDAPSVMNTGAYDKEPRPPLRLQRTSDPGASAWQSEAWYKLIGEEFWTEHALPLWNPYNAYGTPLSANAISQPFFPLTALLSLHVTTWTYNLYIVGRLLLGGMLAFFFARQFLTALPSLFAAVTFMLSGYFVIYLNIAHLSVEVLIPGVFLTFELLLRRNSWGAAAGAAAMILLGMTGGMPESLFLTLAFGALYFVCRLLSTPELRSHATALSIKFVASVVLGFALSGFLLLPFLEFLSLSHDTHQPSNVGGIQGGLGYDGDYYLTIQYLLPLVAGPILNSIFTGFLGGSGLRGYWGIIPFLFSVVAVLALFSRRRLAVANPDRFLTIFFAATLVLMILKRFGSGLINWIGALPLSEMVLYPKYQEPLIAFCIAMLAGIGFAALVERRVATRQLIAAVVITLGVMVAVAATFFPAVRALVKASVFQSVTVKISLFYYLSIACGIALLLAAGVMLWFTQRASAPMRPRLLRGITVLLSLELVFNFIVPCFYLFTSLPPLKADPYKGAPYIDFIRARNADHARVFARENFLYSNWSSVFGLADVRSLDAIQYKRYRTFIRSFLLPPEAEDRQHGDLADRFTGSDFPYEFSTDVEKRYLALSSIRYLISGSDYPAAAPEAYKKIYDSEVRIFEVSNPMPRAALFRAIEILPDDEVLVRLKDPAFNPNEKAVISRESLPEGDAGNPSRLAEAAAAPLTSAQISRYESQNVRIEAETAAPALLVLNDAEFPGWRAYVNGQPAPIVMANYLFRGVFLAPGKSTVEFKYQPRSFQFGAAISLAAFGVLAGLVIGERRRRRATAIALAGKTL